MKKRCPSFCHKEVLKTMHYVVDVCKALNKVMLPPNCRNLFVDSQLVDNCGGTTISSDLHKKLCCKHSPYWKYWNIWEGYTM